MPYAERAHRDFADPVIDSPSIAADDAAAVRALGIRAARQARVIGVGEAAHSVREVQEVQDLIVRALVSESDAGPVGAPGALGDPGAPWRDAAVCSGSGRIGAVVLESGFAESIELDAWVGGAGRDDDLTVMAERGMTYGFGASPEVQRLLAWLRAWNLAHPALRVRVVGMDLPGSSTSPGPAVRACLSGLPPRGAGEDEAGHGGAEGGGAAAGVPGPGLATSDAELLRLTDLGGRTEAAIAYERMSDLEREALRAALERLIARVRHALTADGSDAGAGADADTPGRADAGADALRAAASLEAFLAELSYDPELASPHAPYPREQFMADTVLWAERRYGRTIVLAHNAHVRREPLQGRPTLGTLLAGEYRDAYRVIATTYGSGPAVRFVARSTRPFDCDVFRVHRDPAPGSIEAALEQIRPGSHVLLLETLHPARRRSNLAKSHGVRSNPMRLREVDATSADDSGDTAGGDLSARIAAALGAASGMHAGGEVDPVDDFSTAFDAIVHLREAHSVSGAFERLRAEFGRGSTAPDDDREPAPGPPTAGLPAMEDEDPQ